MRQNVAGARRAAIIHINIGCDKMSQARFARNMLVAFYLLLKFQFKFKLTFISRTLIPLFLKRGPTTLGCIA